MNAFKSTGQSSGLIREAISRAGHRVTLTIAQASHQGAQPTYVITRYTKKGLPQGRRYVPVVYGVLDERHPEPAGQRRVSAEARALGVFGAFAQDLTEPAFLLADGSTDARSATAACPTTPRPGAGPAHAPSPAQIKARATAGERLRAYRDRQKELSAAC